MKERMVAITLLLLVLPLFSPNQTYARDSVSAKVNADLAFTLARIGGMREMQVLVMSDQLFTPTQISDLSRYGRIESVTGHVAVLRMRGVHVPDLAALGYVHSIEGSRPLHLDLDVSVPEIGAPAVYEQMKDVKGSSVDGTGVIIGIADTGIDLTHPDFRFADGTSKILYVWDQGTNGTHSNLVTYGTECTKSDIEAGSCKEYDLNGHGTHVSGIAASSGRATGKYAGVAPGANIIFVKIGEPVCDATSWSASDADAINAFSYILKRAKELGRPAVGSFSFGSLTGGGHDDTSAFERAIDDIVDQGLPIVAAAGNSGGDQVHISGKISEGQSMTGGWEAADPNRSSPMQGYFAEFWYGTEDLLDISLTTPDGKIIQGPTSNNGVPTPSGKVYILEDETTKARGWTIFVESTNSNGLALSGWSFKIEGKVIRGDGAWDGWVDAQTCGPGVGFVGGSDVTIDDSKSIGPPATAGEVIAVGSYITRSRWVAKSGGAVSRPGGIGQISAFSSHGPTRDGRTKPDIAAPGQYVLSAKSLFPGAVLPTAQDNNGLSPDDYHIPLAGTSMATPHVAGVVALMLQFNPSLTPQKILETLRAGARQDSATGQIDPTRGDDTWGWGKIDARTAAGMFRVTLIASNLPFDLKTTVNVDGRNATTLGGSRRIYLAFPQGTTHTIGVDQFILEKLGVRYRATTYNATVTQTGVVDLKYVKQYLLAVNSIETMSVWYDEGSAAKISAPSEVPVQGFLGTIGGKLRLERLINENNQTLNETSILMEGPHNITAFYVEDLSTAYITLGGIVTAIIVVAGLVIIQTRKRKKTT